MGNDLKSIAKAGVDRAVHDTAMELSPDVVASLVINGDLSKLTPAQKVNYYNSLCHRVGLDPATQPFKILRLNGKEVMYADKGATQQLSQSHKISHDVVGKEKDEDVYTVTIRATMPDGRYTVEDGSVSIGGLKGEAFANAKMKAMTKAKRRAVLALLGLGMTDESEIETIEGAEVVAITTAEVVDTKINQPQQEVTNEVAGKPEQEQTQKAGGWLSQCLAAIAMLGPGKKLEECKEWGREAKRRLDTKEIAQSEFDSVLAAFRHHFPPTQPDPVQQTLFNADGSPVSAAPAGGGGSVGEPDPATPTAPAADAKPPASRRRRKAGADSVAGGLSADIEKAEKHSQLFTVRARIGKAELTDQERVALMEALDKRLQVLKATK